MSLFPSVHFVLRSSTKKGTNEGVIQCKIFFGDQATFTTGIKISKSLWDKTKGMPKNSVATKAHETTELLNNIASELLALFKSELDKGNRLSAMQLSAIYRVSKQKVTPKKKTLTDIAIELISDIKGEVKPKTLYEYTHFIEYWAEFIDHHKLGQLEPIEVDKEVIRQYKAYFRDVKGHAWTTIYDRYFKILKRMLLYAREYDHPISNSAITQLKRLRGYDVKRVFLLQEERTYLENLFKNGQASDTIKLIILGMHTGLRHNDLKQSNIWSSLRNKKDNSRPILKIKDEKERNNCIIPITTTAHKILKYFDYKPNYMSNQGFNKAVKRELKKHEIFNLPRRIEGFSEEIVISVDFTSHAMRRTFVNFLLESGIPKEQIMLATGHKTSSVFDIYADYFTSVSPSFIDKVVNL
tara:strand:- start:20258 stop:21490 length:1233 start_codon:yes stop_codon:yes gene_type:complete